MRRPPVPARVAPLFSGDQIVALQLLQAGHRPAAVERVFGLKMGDAIDLRTRAKAAGWQFRRASRRLSGRMLTVAEYVSACRAADRDIDRDQVDAIRAMHERAAASACDDEPWPHLQTHVRDAAPRNAEAAAQASRLMSAARRLRYVPRQFAGGGLYHFGRECVEHLAALIAYAPGPRYPDDPRATAPRRRGEVAA